MIENKTKKQSINAYMWTLLIISFGSFIYSYREMVENYNTTVLAFTYKYGFISRGFIGTLYHGLDSILPVDLINYEAVVWVCLVVTIIIYLIFLCFARYTLDKCQESNLTYLETFWAFFMIMVVSTFSSKRNFGRLDIFMLLFSVLAVWLLLQKKSKALQFMVIPLAAMGVMVHQGYVFMYVSMILVLLIYLYFTTREKRYLVILGLTLLAISVLFIWFQFMSHVNGEAIVGDIIDEATLLTRKGKYHDTLIDAEILGVDLGETEWPLHVQNFVELPAFLILISPYIYIAFKFFKGVFEKCENKADKCKYLLVLLGAATTLPLFILKIDYGRWFLAVFVYYLVMLISLVVLEDKIIIETLQEKAMWLREHKTWAFMLIIYAIMFVPFWDVRVCQLLKSVSDPINEMWLHMW
ncbi:MAG: hypothetical protein K6B67_04640 [Lachnospiraceae bacterium]|nr:hypothetical protein [Lachnospiraceae bacterium]